MRRGKRSAAAVVRGRLAAPHGDRELLQRGRLRALLGLEFDMAHRKSRLHPVLSEHSPGLDSLHLPVGLLPSVLPIPSLS